MAIMMIVFFVILYTGMYFIGKALISLFFERKAIYTSNTMVSQLDIVQGYKNTIEYIKLIVDESIKEVLILNPTTIQNKEYLTEEDEMDLRKQVLSRVKYRISDQILTVLFMYFSDPFDIIAHYIYLGVTDLIVENNTSEV
jgi:hypothetical protein